MAGQRQNTVEELEEILELLRITEDNVQNRSTEPATSETEEMSTAPAPAGYNENISTAMPKSMVPNPGWFDGNRTKFKDQQREIRLFLKSNRVVAIDNKITIVLA